MTARAMPRPGEVPLGAWVALAAGIIAVQALVEHAMGRLAICACGYVKLFEPLVNSPGNSQHLSDWYSPSHLIHGMIFYAAFRLVGRGRWPIGLSLVLAVAVEACWEMAENTDAVIERYRAATISLDYYGDSILNSVSDTLFCIAGFLLAWRLPAWASIGLAAAMEIGVGIAIRDNLTLNVLMLVHPFEWVKEWQMAGPLPMLR